MLKRNAQNKNNQLKMQKRSYSFGFLNDLSQIYKRFLLLMILFLLFDKVQGECLPWGPNNQCSFCDYKCGPVINRTQTVQHGTCSYLGEDLTGFQCLDKCCGFVAKNIFNGKSNRTTNCQPLACQIYKERLIIAIILPSVGFIFCIVPCILIICVASIYYCKKQNQINANSDNPILPSSIVSNQVASNQKIHSATNLLSQQFYDNDLPQLLENNKKLFLLKIKQVCMICMQNHTETITKCGHYFHIDCIGKWIDKNSKCPLCNGDQQRFNPLIIYCKKCHYRVLGVKIDIKKGSVYQLMQKYKQTFCSTCKQQ